MRRIAFFAYGTICYVIFLAVYLYAIGWVGNVLVPRSIDVGPVTPIGAAVAVNLGLLGLFAVQHSVMARPTFKRWWTRHVPKPIERSTYVMMSNLALILLFWQWRPIDVTLWDVANPAARGVLWAVFGCGWMLVLVSTFLINHFDLFGMRQVWLYLRGREYTRLAFRVPALYRYVRHPLYVGWLMAFWATPTMTAGHLLFAAVCTTYILVAIRFEERNLIEELGRDYAEYRRRVPMLIPSLAPAYGRAQQDESGTVTSPSA